MDEIRNNVFFSKVLPDVVNKKSNHVAKRLPDIDRLSKVILSDIANSI